MLLILSDNVRKLGKIGDVVKTKPGYGRYLLSQRVAIRATKNNLNILQQKREVIEQENIEKLQKAKDLQKLLEGQCLVVIKQHVSDDGKLYGSVTSREISQLLCEQSYQVHHTNIIFKGTIKQLGSYTIDLELYPGLVLPITLYVVKNASAAEEAKKNHAALQKKDTDLSSVSANKDDNKELDENTLQDSGTASSNKS